MDAYAQKGDARPELDKEQEAVMAGALPLYIIVPAAKALYENAKTYKLVFVSNSRVATSRFIVTKALEAVGISKQEIDIILQDSDIYDTSEFGTKKEPNAWKKIFKHYQSIDVIVEDSSQNLEAATRAAQELGYQPKTSPHMTVF
jgi:hypothetical protein